MTIERPEEESERAWWEDLPSDTDVEIIVMAKVSKENLPTPRSEKTAKLLTRNKAAVQGVVDFMTGNPDRFAGIDLETAVKMNNLGHLSFSAKPSQCTELMSSGLIE